MAYVIKHKTQNLYIHFNPKTSEYWLSDKLDGACAFYYDNAINLMKQNHQEEDFMIVDITAKVSKIIEAKNEKEFLDAHQQ